MTIECNFLFYFIDHLLWEAPMKLKSFHMPLINEPTYFKTILLLDSKIYCKKKEKENIVKLNQYCIEFYLFSTNDKIV